MRKVPHWVYFLGNEMVYFSKAFDCKAEKLCEVKLTEVIQQK
jgi:hypothetical protein